MIDKDFKQLISSAIINGELTEKKHEFLKKKAEQEGVDLDELEVVIESLLTKSSADIKQAKGTTSKIGSIKRCPACGAVISFESKCPKCGYVLNSISATESVKSLFKELKSLNSKDVFKKKQIIESFPVPRSKEDILEFLILLKPKASDPNERFNHIFLNKYSECLEKSKVYFPGDPDFLPFIEELSEIKKKSKKGAFGRFIKNHKLLTILFFIGLFYALFYIILFYYVGDEVFPDKSIEKEVRTMIVSGDYEAARQLANSVESEWQREDYLDDITVAEIEALINDGLYDDARTRTLTIKSDYKRENTVDDIIQKEVATLVLNNQLEEALQAASAINSEYKRGNTTDGIKSKLIDRFIENGDIEHAEQMARTMYNEYTRSNYLERINNIK